MNAGTLQAVSMRYMARVPLAVSERLFVPQCTSAEFQTARAFLQRWVLRWIDEPGHMRPDAEPLPDRGCDDK
jgi:hypothetical protein